MVDEYTGFPDGSVAKNQPANAKEVSSIPGLGRSPGIGNGSSLQYSCLGNPMDRGAWWAAVHGVTKSQTYLVAKQQQQGWIHGYCFIFIFRDIHLLAALAPSFDLCSLWQGHLINICRAHLLFPSQLLCSPAEWGMTNDWGCFEESCWQMKLYLNFDR